MKKHLFGVMVLLVLFSSKALAHLNIQEWAMESLEYDKQEVVNEIPALFAKTLNQYQLKGALEPDIESIQLNLVIPYFLVKQFNRAVELVLFVPPIPQDTVNTQRYVLEMDVTDTESGDPLKLKCQVSINYDFSTGSFNMRFFDASLLRGPVSPCNLTYQEEDDEVQIFHDLSLNPHHEFPNPKRQRLLRFAKDTASVSPRLVEIQ